MTVYPADLSEKEELAVRMAEVIKFLKRNPRWMQGFLDHPDDIAREEAFDEWQRMLTDLGGEG